MHQHHNLLKHAFLIIVVGFFTTCTRIDKTTSQCEDEEEMINLAVRSKNFKAILMEFPQYRNGDSSIYINSANRSKIRCSYKGLDGNKFRYLENYRSLTHEEQSHDNKIVISAPEFRKLNDTVKLSFDAYKFYIIFEYKFVKVNNTWKIISDNERFYNVKP